MFPSKLDLLQGTIDASLVRLEQRGWIGSKWSVSDNSRRAKLYAITAAGRRQYEEDSLYRRRLTGVIDRLLGLGEDADLLPGAEGESA